MGLFDKAREKLQDLLDKTDLDEKAAQGFRTLKEKGQELLDRTDLDEKAAQQAEALRHKAGESVESLRRKAQDLLDKTGLDEKAAEGAKAVRDAVNGAFSREDPEMAERKRRWAEISKDLRIVVEEEPAPPAEDSSKAEE